MSVETSSFRERVLVLVSQIPAGQVATYGQIAALAGSPRAARQVGGVLSALPPDTAVPWQRVINRQGSLSTWRKGCGELQQALLEAEGIVFNASGACDLSRYGWAGPALAAGSQRGAQ
ncbi:MAG: MGMT family protein [Candidatus Sericytochromatia bacterium]|nr:MGMT family protein [Candidatus Sericytochromatia bacterium]